MPSGRQPIRWIWFQPGRPSLAKTTALVSSARKLWTSPASTMAAKAGPALSIMVSRYSLRKGSWTSMYSTMKTGAWCPNAVPGAGW